MRNRLKSLLTVIVGTLIVAVALDVFLAPADIAPGGVSGISIIIRHLTGLPLGTLIFILNIPIFFWGLLHFGKKFLVSSLFGMFLLSVFTDVFGFLPRITENVLLCAIYGGLLMGFGIGLIFSAGYTTGGTDIVVQILRKKRPNISIGRLVLIIDAFIICAAGIVFGQWEILLYSALSLYISTFIIDIIVEGGDSSKVAYIISDHPKALAEGISNELKRGSTHLHASSFYSNSQKSILLCVVKKYEITKLKTIIKDIDSNAFVILSDAREVLGKGFKSY